LASSHKKSTADGFSCLGWTCTRILVSYGASRDIRHQTERSTNLILERHQQDRGRCRRILGVTDPPPKQRISSESHFSEPQLAVFLAEALRLGKHVGHAAKSARMGFGIQDLVLRV
jgi:hypothetical protein